jgi:putative membrane-bound dehydrogenase-like protein
MGFALGFMIGLATASQALANLGVPDGFAVTEFAGSELANDIYCMTIDPSGRIIVSGRGYLRFLLDDDGDGCADRAVPFAAEPADGAMGLLWEGDSLYFTGGGGLRRLRDADNDGRADGPSELIRAMKTGGEHESHAIRRGPDGWLYVICGNSTGLNRGFIKGSSSPIVDPVAGCVVRFSPDFERSEIVADGFRNAYDMDFNPDGELFAYDSDNERCVSLPWYEPTRLYHVIPGQHHGWLNPQFTETWRLPPYFLDVAEPVCTLGRGSPTGVACYRHAAFPEEYRGGFFLADWTFGRIWFVKPSPSGASYEGTPRVFLEAKGNEGFAPTDLAVHPLSGDLYISIGGRGTRGAVYRVRYERAAKIDPAAVAALQPKPRSLEWRTGDEPALVKAAIEGQPAERLRALLAMQRHVELLSRDAVQAAVEANWGLPDRALRAATVPLIASGRLDAPFPSLSLRARSTFHRALLILRPELITPGSCPFPRSAEAIPPEEMLDAVRVIQLASGDVGSPRYRGNVWEGYSPRDEPIRFASPDEREHVLDRLRGRFPSGHARLDRELSRTLAIYEDEDPTTLRKVVDCLTGDSDPIDDIHFLIVASRLKAPRTPEITQRIATALLALDRKLDARHARRDTNWPLRITELTIHLVRKDRALNAAIVSNPDFGRPDHALFTRAPGLDRAAAAEVFLKRALADPDYAWNADLVEIIDELPEERSLPVLRSLWGRSGLDEAILPILARKPRPEDREKFLEGLRSPRLAVIDASLEALDRLPADAPAETILALIRTLNRLPAGKIEAPLRERVASSLRRLTGQDQLAADGRAWTEWLTQAHPDRAAKLGGSDGVDRDAWARRLAAIDWSAGDGERGAEVFKRASCANCHNGSRAVGPALDGVAGRFSREDLFTAIIEPSRDVSPRYQATAIATRDGLVHQGMIVYDAVDGLILQTGATTTVRIAGADIEDRRPVAASFMPAGLLDRLSDGEIADLDAYLRSLKAAP